MEMGNGLENSTIILFYLVIICISHGTEEFKCLGLQVLV